MDKVLERIASALERIADHVSTPILTMSTGAENTTKSIVVDFETPTDTPNKKKVAKKVKDEAPAVESTQVVTLAALGDVVRKLVHVDPKSGHANAVSLLAEFGAKRIAEVKEADFPAILAKVNALLAAAKGK